MRHEADIVKTAHKARTACKHAVFRLHSLSGNEATTSLDMFREIILCALLVVVLVVVVVMRTVGGKSDRCLARYLRGCRARERHGDSPGVCTTD